MEDWTKNGQRTQSDSFIIDSSERPDKEVLKTAQPSSGKNLTFGLSKISIGIKHGLYVEPRA